VYNSGEVYAPAPYHHHALLARLPPVSPPALVALHSRQARHCGAAPSDAQRLQNPHAVPHSRSLRHQRAAEAQRRGAHHIVSCSDTAQWCTRGRAWTRASTAVPHTAQPNIRCLPPHDFPDVR
jgi:hypothetical protein